ISEYLNKPEIRVLFPKDMDFRWSYKPTISQDGKTSYYELYAIKKRKNRDEAPLEGDRVTDAFSYPDPRSGQVLVSLKMDPQGARTWGDMTTKAAQDNNREIAIVLDNKVVSCPRVNDPILSGDSQISGTFTIDEGKDLASILQIGKLPAKTEIIQESLVGPSLGKDNINKSFNSIGIAFALLCIFMIFYYAGGGVVSVLAMLLNLFFLIGASASLGTVMTLPGIAGILLTLAVAVDTNVITYERIREELRHGKPLLQAIKDGFRLSSSAILDANVTTLLTAIVLNIYGLGPIKGFAIILIVGILTTLFTAMLVARLMIDYWTGKGNDIKFWRPFSQHFMENVNIDWMKYRKSAYIFSGILTLISLISIFTRGFDLGVDFKGGYSYTVQFDKDISIEKVRDALTKSFGSTPIVKVVDTKNTYNITTSYLVNDNSATAQSNVLKKLHEGIVAVDGNIDINEFTKAEGKGTHIISSSKVGSTIADDIQRSSFLSAGLASLLIFIYLLIRFSRWQFSMGAVLAVLHDLIITLGVFSLLRGIMPFSMEIDQALIAAILTVIGYSVNDTVIVFDRIREFLHTYAGKTKEEIFNVAINSTLSRTIITSGVTTFVCLILLIFGGGAIKGFAFALFIGIFFGTYSSVYIASAIAVDLMKDITPREVKAQVKETAKPAKA
ncbi:MAG: protein translocase subunit SecD, partial [Saprospiraceae bacterium]